MPKSPTQERFDSLVSNSLWPEFKARGYRKTGNNFRFYSPSGWGKIANIQKSMSSERHDIRFTINTGLYLPEADIIFEKPKGPKFLEPDCLVRKRVGVLSNLEIDLWYDLTESTPIGALEARVTHDVSHSIIPYLEGIQTRDDILKQVIRERKPNEEMAIRTLFLCGYQEEARQWVKDEINTTIYRTWRQRLLMLSDSFAKLF